MSKIAGEGHSFLTMDQIALEAVTRLVLETPAFGLCGQRTSKTLAKRNGGLKAGTSYEIKRATRAQSGRGRKTTSADAQPMVQRTVTLTVDQRHNMRFEWTDEDATFNITEFGDNFLQPSVEYAALQADMWLSRKFAEAGNGLGTPGTNFVAGDIQNVAARADRLGHGKTNRFCLTQPEDVADMGIDIVNRLDGVAKMKEGILRMSYMGKVAGYDIVTSTQVPTLNVADFAPGASVPTVMSAGGFEGELGSSLPTDGWGVNNTLILNANQLFTIDGVRSVSPNKDEEISSQDDGLQVFTVLEDVTTDAAGRATIKISPDLNAGGLETVDGNGDAVSMKAYQNVSAAAAEP